MKPCPLCAGGAPPMTAAWTVAEARRRREARHVAAVALIQRNPGKGSDARATDAYSKAVEAFNEVPKALRDAANDAFERDHVCTKLDTCPMGPGRRGR